MTIQVPVTRNEYTGTFDKLKVVGVSPAFNTAPRVGMTGSLDCKNGWKSPSLNAPSFWTDAGCEGSYQSSYVCKKPAVQVDVSDTKARYWKSVPTNQTIQMMRDGERREVKFSQEISGKNITVKSIKTQFTRSGTSWDSSQKLNKNLLEMRTTSGLGLKNAGETGVQNGNVSSVFVMGYQASNPNGQTKIGQKLSWTGTKKVKSIKITSVDSDKGTVTTQSTTVTVPTSGECKQEIGLQYIRSIGDVQ
ncbi:hypothetical protein DFO58_1321 [Arthrobacter sp. AG1021]|nr:hypothetical protein DFO58_1321 [Arthrobacter sp. AG1021]